LDVALRPRQCPSCGASLQRTQAILVVECPSCGDELVISFFQRSLIVLLAGVLAWVVPALLAKNTSISPLMFIFYIFLGLPMAAQIVTMILPAKYEQRRSGVTRLFRR